MKAIIKWYPKAMQSLYGDAPKFELTLVNRTFVLTANTTTTIEVSPGDYDILSATYDAVSSQSRFRGLSWTLVQDDETTPGDWGTVFTDSIGANGVEHIKCANADKTKVTSGVFTVGVGSTLMTFEGILYTFGNDSTWHQHS